MSDFNNCGENVEGQKPRKKIDFKQIAGIAVGVIVLVLVQQFFFKSPDLDKMLMKTASEMNELCPVMIDSETRLDNAIALPAKTFQYNYTLVSTEKDSVDIVVMKDILEPRIRTFVCTSPDMKTFRDNKVTVNYYYSDKNGNYLLTISVSPEQYK